MQTVRWSFNKFVFLSMRNFNQGPQLDVQNSHPISQLENRQENCQRSCPWLLKLSQAASFFKGLILVPQSVAVSVYILSMN